MSEIKLIGGKFDPGAVRLFIDVKIPQHLCRNDTYDAQCVPPYEYEESIKNKYLGFLTN